MYKLISLANLVNNIDYEKINHIKNEVSYIKDILSIHNYELVDLASEWLQRDFIPVFCNSQGDVLPSFAQYQYNKSTNLMLCTIIHNKINSNSNSHRMKMFYRSLGRKPRRFIFVDECRIVSDNLIY